MDDIQWLWSPPQKVERRGTNRSIRSPVVMGTRSNVEKSKRCTQPFVYRHLYDFSTLLRVPITINW